jgi:glycosyltransferase involved in cell wall biosynthesis
VVDAGHLCIAATAEQFAEKTLSPLTNEELMHRITNQARDLVVNRYDWEVIAQRLMQIYVEVAK